MTSDVRGDLARLIALDGMGPIRLRAVLRGRTPGQAVAAVESGRPPLPPDPGESSPPMSAQLRTRWQRQIREIDRHAALARYEEEGFTTVVLGEREYPKRLADDPDPPVLLAVDGDLKTIADRTVAIVGTRRCTRAGVDTAYSLGRDLAAAGVTVVSGLAAGIDSAAHRGALEAAGAAPLAVAGTGLDVIYPVANRTLWNRVAEAGAIVSESPPGAQPDRWRFPARNRIIAGFSDLVVVVESDERGGSMHTVDEAARRDVEVLAVPGPVRSRASRGTNELIHAGRGVARDATDVLIALGLTPRFDAASAAAGHPDETAAALLEAFEWAQLTVDQLVLRTGLDVLEVCDVLERLVEGGWVVRGDGWYERCSEPCAR